MVVASEPPIKEDPVLVPHTCFRAFRRWPASSAQAEVIEGSSPTFRQHGNLERGHNNRLAG
jgi:hypothetical protein